MKLELIEKPYTSQDLEAQKRDRDENNRLWHDRNMTCINKYLLRIQTALASEKGLIIKPDQYSELRYFDETPIGPKEFMGLHCHGSIIGMHTKNMIYFMFNNFEYRPDKSGYKELHLIDENGKKIFIRNKRMQVHGTARVIMGEFIAIDITDFKVLSHN